MAFWNFLQEANMDVLDLQNERDAFEQLQAQSRPTLCLERHGALYSDPIAQARWESWTERGQALRNAPIAPEGFAIVARTPSPALLMSMAARHDHGLGVPGYYDQLKAFFLENNDGPTHAQAVAAALREMAKLHEEVVGDGFYNPLDESFHANMLLQSKAQTEGKSFLFSTGHAGS
jgi:hypothetical protein